MLLVLLVAHKGICPFLNMNERISEPKGKEMALLSLSHFAWATILVSPLEIIAFLNCAISVHVMLVLFIGHKWWCPVPVCLKAMLDLKDKQIVIFVVAYQKLKKTLICAFFWNIKFRNLFNRNRTRLTVEHYFACSKLARN